MQISKTITKGVLALMLGIWMYSGSAQSQDSGEGHKIVFQLTDDDPRSHKALVNQLKNLTTGWPEAKMEVVVHSAGIGFLLKDKTPYAQEIRELSAKGVEFKACENTLTSKNIPREAVMDVAGFVPMGIAEVVLKQEKGWSYIKAGI